jgi:beta-ketodecanoyl-[acyl-carrier-protein] synthase
MYAAAISATGLFVPPETITNDELVESFNQYVERINQSKASEIAAGTFVALQPSSTAFIEKASGIKQRYVMDKAGVLDPQRMRPKFTPRGDDQLSLTAEIAVIACQDALKKAGKTAQDVDAIICSSSNTQRAYPAVSIEIQQALGMDHGFGYDMNVACSAATFALQNAVNLVQTGTARAVLVVNPEITSAHLDWKDRDCHFIFGDVCTATLVERLDLAPAGAFEILGSRCATQFSNNIRNNFGFMSRAEDRDPDDRDQLFRQEGRKVFKDVCPMAAEHIDHHLADAGLKPTDVRRFWLHQANYSMNQFIVRRLLDTEPNQDQAPIILDEFANTSSAGSIIAFHRHSDDLKAGDVGVICSFGAGYSIGSVVVRRT